ncbi:MAG: ribosome biogenesis GTPase Der [Alphaproteobacteria bacterium]|nr:ribosome biogenesis GTPase Der [Alphaproteobacteria bacterium]
MFKIAIIGRPNVGKSTLFNKLVGKSFAMTDDTPGVTRDRKEASAKLGPLEFVVIDTAGLENEIDDKSLEKRMLEQTEVAVADADLCLFVLDAKEGVTNKDFHFAQWLRKLGKKTILLTNKCENLNEEVFGSEYYKLGFGKPVGISAEHKLGFGDIYEKIAPEIEEYEKIFQQETTNYQLPDSDLQIAIVGRPNAGKSTFLNKILGQERLITGPEAGITRDSIALSFEFKKKKIRLIDTAGIRKKSNIVKKLEKLSTLDSFRAIRFAQVVILLIDCNSLLDHQDVALAGEILKEGRGLVFGINKIDMVSGDKEVFLREVRKQIQSLFPEIDGAAILGVSGQTGYNVEKCLDFALKTYEQWQSYISTSKLVEWLKTAAAEHAPKLHHGKTVKLKYITQIKKRPPTFAIFTNYIKPLEGAYQRYLTNHLREYFDLKLTPIRMVFRKSKNPFEGKREKVFSKKTHKKK